MYQSLSLVSLSGLAIKSSYPTRGLPAGCSFATYLVQAICHQPLASWQSRFRHTPCGMFIDDIMVRAMAESYGQLINRLVPAIRALYTMIATELECTVANHKTAVVAPHPKLQVQLHAALGKMGGSLSGGSASNLGIDYFSGALRCHKSSRKQLLIRSK